MKRSFLIICLLYGLFLNAFSQDQPVKVYNPDADAQADIRNAVARAAKQGKFVFIQVGGNWCSWCLAFNKLTTVNDTLRTAMNGNFEVVHVNYSKENKNESVLTSLGYPQRFGFPVFVILDDKGNRIHTQNSAYLEEGKGHSAKKVLEFLKGWSPAALNPKTYVKSDSE